MTAPLSARIRALEAIAEMLPALIARREELEREIAEATQARMSLDLLDDQVGAVLASGPVSALPGMAASTTPPEPWDDTALLVRERVLLLLHARAPLSAREITATLNTPGTTLHTVLRKLVGQGELGSRPAPQRPETGGVPPNLYHLKSQEPAPEGELPASAPMPPLPDGLSHDERNAYDCLRHTTTGLSDRMLAARLNWKQSRANAALAGLVRQSLIADESGRWQVHTSALGAA